MKEVKEMLFVHFTCVLYDQHSADLKKYDNDNKLMCLFKKEKFHAPGQ
jgi:hypothetical protein